MGGAWRSGELEMGVGVGQRVSSFCPDFLFCLFLCFHSTLQVACNFSCPAPECPKNLSLPSHLSQLRASSSSLQVDISGLEEWQRDSKNENPAKERFLGPALAHSLPLTPLFILPPAACLVPRTEATDTKPRAQGVLQADGEAAG